MQPILFKIGFLTVYTYGVFVALAFLAASACLVEEARRRHLDENAMYNLCLVLIVAGLLGARIFYVALNGPYFLAHPVEIFMLQRGGLVWFGGLFGAALAGWLFMRAKKLPVLVWLELVAPYVALAQAIGRIGCYFNGCCYGFETTTCGFYFPVHQEWLFPSQLVDSASLLAVYASLRWFQSRSPKPGLVFSGYLVLAGLQRFLMEFLRGDERPFYGPFSIFQWIGLAVIAAGLVSAVMIWKKKAA